MSPTIADVMAKMPTAFLPEKAGGMEAVVQFQFRGTETDTWYAIINHGACSVVQGTAAEPDLTLTADTEDFLQVYRGELDGMQAFLQGRLEFAGDRNLALKLLSVFKID